MSAKFLILALIGAASTYPNPDSKSTNKNTDKPIIPTPLGQIQGSILASRSGRQIFSFRGIRYAKAPVEELRFQPPVPAEKWENVYNATQDGALCPQPTDEPTAEDCLFLNVYTTKLPNASDQPKHPVIVFVHGGGFHSTGSTTTWLGPQYLLDQEIVLVTFNYRLGTLGFLSTGDKEAPGNNGLKDQVLALKWIKDNIAAFGGDPEHVTLAGHGTGATSVTLHLVSPLSQGLFHRAIVMSGSALGQIPIPHHQLELAKKQAKILECDKDETSADVIKCLRGKTAHELGDSQPKFLEFGNDPVIVWNPVIEGDFGQERFLAAHPVELISKGEFAHVPVILGVTTDEFASRAFDVVSNETLKKQMTDDFLKVAPIAFLFERETEKSKTVSDALEKFYLNDKPIDESSVAGLGQLYADSIVGFGVHRAAELLSEKSNQSVYYYRFNYKGQESHFYLPNNKATPYGVVHNDDLIYLFYIQKLFPLFKDTDSGVQTLTKFTQLWANFAKTGNPTSETNDKLDNIKWEPFTVKNQKYLDIGNKLVLNEKLYEKRYAEWSRLFPVTDYTEPKKSGKA